MADFRVRSLEPGQTKIRNVPIAVTPEGFWCCPAPVLFQRTIRHQSNQNKQKSSPPRKINGQKSTNPPGEKRQLAHQLKSLVSSEDQKCLSSDSSCINSAMTPEEVAKANSVNPPRKISVGFGKPDTCDLKVILYGKENIAVRMNVHRNILSEHSSFFAEKLAKQSPVICIEIGDCEDVEIYVEAIGLMYCKEIKQRLIKLSVAHVLRMLKVAEALGFQLCVKSCLDYLEAVPWVGDEEENVVSSIRCLGIDKYGVSPILKRVSSDISYPPNDTLARILELVLKSNEDKGRREMKVLVLKLLKENNQWMSGSADICSETLYNSCQTCLQSLLLLFREASEPDFVEKDLLKKETITRQIVLEADNLLWLVEILSDRRIADDFVVIWANQEELASLHSKLSIVSRHLISCITARIFVGIGKGEMLPSKDVRQMLLQVWLQQLIDDYGWLQHGCRSFDRKVVEEGIGRTILTLPLEDQQTMMLSWLGSFLKVGDNCPNLQRAFEVWWRRTFIRPYLEQRGNTLQSDRKFD
ncbi:BTB/POZ domain-containing protein At3g50780 [Phalaenopsis equestris]|uniref:BTB/POZ domain-containing protein At3g50780 n=1 Tax=Phalaenopsis equestris TaxID=78828 RepID=UPI0009E38787|nr:BTB/POZ domain-containing protein At3g50780 [Phalaenopsis equestris]XP_020583473.1 BTB/POZ domain-containing protein At3g50780 [Phalaenopsis equestris]XP_020583474.1 BTB/POZ domain-containing protein At3g50780 [Phalaenopsis equestris]